MLPPRLVRRFVLAPLAIVIAVAVAMLSPLLALLTAVFGLRRRLRPGRMRGPRLLYFALVWLAAEASALFMSLGLWLASGLGGRLQTEPYRSRHYAIMKWFLDLVYGAATRTLGLRVEVDEPPRPAGAAGDRPARPVIVLSRHAGPGDSFLLVHHLLSVYGRRPRIVLKASLQLDPGIDVIVNRLPNVFIQRRQTGEIGHSHVGPGSRTPRRTLCPEATPRFDATDFGAPAYARLARDAPLALRRGASDEGELGAYHDRWETVRIDDLRTQLHGYAPAGVGIDIRLAT